MFCNQRAENFGIFRYNILSSGQRPRFPDNYCADIFSGDKRADILNKTRGVRQNGVREAHHSRFIRESQPDSFASIINS